MYDADDRILEDGQEVVGVSSRSETIREASNSTVEIHKTDLRREFLESLSVRVPLLEWPLYHNYRTIATFVKAVLLKRTSKLHYDTFAKGNKRLMATGVSAQWVRSDQQCRVEGVGSHRLLCGERSYAETGHWYAGYVLEMPSEPFWRKLKRRRYPPHFAVPKPGPMDYSKVSIGDETSQRHSIQFRLSIIDELRMAILESMGDADPPGGHSRLVLQGHDRIQRLHALLGVGPRLRVGLSVALSMLARGSHCATVALTVLYWTTRQTTTGISRSGLSFAVAGGLLRNIAGTWSYYKYTLRRSVFCLVIWPIILLPAVLQLRLLLPFVIEEEDTPKGTTTRRIRKSPCTARERRSVRLSPNWQQLSALTFVLACASYALFRHPVLLLSPTHDDREHQNYDPMFPGSRAWNTWYGEESRNYVYHSSQQVFRRIRLLPLSQALVSAGQLAQLIMNYRSGTFAGNYALSCYLKAVSLIGLIAPFLSGDAYFEGLYLSAVAQAVLALTEAWQAWRYPRVEQEVEGEQMEL